MNVGVPTETAPDESRVALDPPAAKKLVARGLDVLVSSGAGTDAGWSDDAYRDVDCQILAERSEVFARADVVLQVRGLGATGGAHLDQYRDGQVVIGLLDPYDVSEESLSTLAERGVSAFALELVPRISRAQSMDVLTSSASIAGYKAVLLAANELPKVFPMQMTAAGTVRPATVFVLGAGVAGLQAIATAKRLGARVRAYDIRPAVKEEVESLGAEFLQIDVETAERDTEGGYAREQAESVYDQQRRQMTDAVADSDVVVTTAAVPGRPAPELLTCEMVEAMAPGSVVVDLGAPSGGNCECTRPDETVVHDGVTIVGPTNLPSSVSHTASHLFASNVVAFLTSLLQNGDLHIDTADEVVDATLLVHDGVVRAPHREVQADD